MSTSRYQGLDIAPIGALNERAEIATRMLVDGDALERAGKTFEYTVTQGDRIDRLAYKSLGDSRLWWLLADLNPHVDPLFLKGGDVLRFPRLDLIR